ncbi:MAG: hypothetical protein A3B68_04435 [Candidatus Melainabacteria bacterium RIFCSPHIGHO2_02_FULL_34_12]|nr:MAG: hypothetical protein A3B68_04435 [Candidatus Melainabacteria bacterium RIFCSPHIGHO2_02_FULL_34_12]
MNKRRTLRTKSNLTKLGELIPKVKESLGLGNSLKITALCEIWPLVTSFAIGKSSQPAYFDRDNNLVIAVKNSTLATELSMQKTRILAKLKEATKNTDITFKDIRFTLRF